MYNSRTFSRAKGYDFWVKKAHSMPSTIDEKHQDRILWNFRTSVNGINRMDSYNLMEFGTK